MNQKTNHDLSCALTCDIVHKVTSNFQDSQRHLEQLQVLHKISKVTTSTLDLHDLLNTLLKEIASLLPYSVSYVSLPDQTTGEWRLVAFHNFDGEEWIKRLHKGKKGLTWAVIESQAPVAVENIRADLRTRDPQFIREHGLVSYLGVPLKARGETLGVLGLFSKKKLKLSADEIQLYCMIAGLVAMAIQNSCFYEQARRRAEELSALYTVAVAAAQSLDPAEVFKETSKKIRDIFHFDLTNILFYNRERKELYLPAFSSPYLSRPPGSVFRAGEGIVGRVGLTGKPLVFEDIQSDSNYWALSAHHAGIRSGWRFYAAYQIKAKGQVLGVLLCRSRKPAMWSSQADQLLTAMTSQIAVAVKNTQLFEHVIRQASQLQQSREQLRHFASHQQSAREQERAEIAREIHDELGQILTALKIDLVWLGRRISKRAPMLIDKVKSMSHLLDQTFQTVRNIASQLRPWVLDNLGLTAAIEWQLQDFENRTGIRWQAGTHLEQIQLDQNRSTALFRILQECLTNVLRHARASEVEVNLKRENADVVLQITDNGIGIEPTKVYDPKALGFLGIRERVWLLGGEATIIGSQGAGTTVTARLPFEANTGIMVEAKESRL